MFTRLALKQRKEEGLVIRKGLRAILAAKSQFPLTTPLVPVFGRRSSVNSGHSDPKARQEGSYSGKSDGYEGTGFPTVHL
jgi:hypothetical protein